MVLDSKNQIWTFVNWGRPFRLDSPMLDCSSPETTPVQAESGWSFSSILTQSGDVLVFWQDSGEVGRLCEEENHAMDERGDSHAYPTENHHIPCVAWTLRADPLRIPHIPQLPELNDTGSSEEERSKDTALIKIAAFDNHIIGLTNKGHVLKFGDLSNENSFDRTTRWQYVRSSFLCAMDKLTYNVVREFQ
jgi:SCF-associated factor 1